MKFLKSILLSAAALLSASLAHAQYNLLVSQSTGELGYGYGFSQWTQFTANIKTAAGNNSFTISTAANLSDTAAVLAADSLFIDQRWTTGAFSGVELKNIAAFIATGKHVVFVGENTSWLSWNNQFLSLLGDSALYANGDVAYAVGSSSLLNGVKAIVAAGSGLSAGSSGTALFDANICRLYGPSSNVLTILDVNMFANTYYGESDNSTFAVNVANWATTATGETPVTAVPEPSTYGLIGAASLLGLGALRRRKAKKA